MNLEQEIEEISKKTIKILSDKKVTIDMLDWILAQVKEKIYANTRIISDDEVTNVIAGINKISKLNNVTLQC